MLQHVLDFLGIEYQIVWSDELIQTILPVVLCIAGALIFYLMMCFFQFLHKLLKVKE